MDIETAPEQAGVDPRGGGPVVTACRAMVEAGGPMAAEELERVTRYSSRQLARMFADQLGVTPSAFGRAVRTGEARRLLRDHDLVLDAVVAAGFASTRGFYETTGPTLGMKPAEYAAGARGLELRWTSLEADLGVVLAVAGDRGLAAVRIGPDVEALLTEVHAEFPGAHWTRDDDGLADLAAGLRLLADGAAHPPDLPLDLRGTAFQARVWAALRRIPVGQTRTYRQVAEDIGAPAAVRAVAGACAANPVALVIPCHRVVRTDGGLGGYRWGVAVKQHLLDRERA